jgi:hypothetical protein
MLEEGELKSSNRQDCARVKLLLSLLRFEKPGASVVCPVQRRHSNEQAGVLNVLILTYSNKGYTPVEVTGSLPIAATRHVRIVNLVLDIPRPFLPITNGCRYHYRIG